MHKKTRKRKRLLLDKEILKLLTTPDLVQGGVITYTTSMPPENCLDG